MVRKFAGVLEYDHDGALLDATIHEEGRADRRLTRIAERSSPGAKKSNREESCAAQREEGSWKPIPASYCPESWQNPRRRWPIYYRRMNSHPAAARQRRCAYSPSTWPMPASGLALREDTVLNAPETCSSNAPGTLWPASNSTRCSHCECSRCAR